MLVREKCGQGVWAEWETPTHRVASVVRKEQRSRKHFGSAKTFLFFRIKRRSKLTLANLATALQKHPQAGAGKPLQPCMAPLVVNWALVMVFWRSAPTKAWSKKRKKLHETAAMAADREELPRERSTPTFSPQTHITSRSLYSAAAIQQSVGGYRRCVGGDNAWQFRVL